MQVVPAEVLCPGWCKSGYSKTVTLWVIYKDSLKQAKGEMSKPTLFEQTFMPNGGIKDSNKGVCWVLIKTENSWCLSF